MKDLNYTRLPLARLIPALLRLACVAASLTATACAGADKPKNPDHPNKPGEPLPVPDVAISQQAITMHRLNRVEYSNTVRDLLGEPLALGATLPEDQINALGFDNDGTSLLTSPLLVARWADVAEELVDNYSSRRSPLSQKFTNIVKPPCTTISRGVDLCGTTNGGYYMNSASSGYWGMISATAGLTVDQMTVPADGVYEISMHAFATPVISAGGAGKTPAGKPYPVTLSVSIDGSPTTFDITTATFEAPKAVSVTATLSRGAHALAITSVRNTIDPDNQDGNWYAKAAFVGDIALVGPASSAKTPDWFNCSGATPSPDGTPAAPDSDACVSSILQNFATRAWRRPAADDEVSALRSLVTEIQQSDEPGDAATKTNQGLKLAFRAALLSPYFVYRPELDPQPDSSAPRKLNGYELASRLSYFLWSSMPDDELFALAANDSLKDVLEQQVNRMLLDTKAQAFVQSFSGQWLQLRRIAGVSPDTTLFPKFDGDVRTGMLEETQAFFAEFLKPGYAFPDMLDADFTFLTPALAGFYGLEADAGERIKRTSLVGTKRSGLLSQGSLLTLTSHANRTSPVLRGKFVLKQLLCSAPPPPPANVPPFNEDQSAGSVRERLEAHVAEPCVGCHKLMDPIGFSMENFDAVGAYRDKDQGKDIDTSGLALGETPVSDIRSLAAAVKASPDFAPCVVQNLLSYALGHQVANDTDSGVPALVKASAATGYELAGLIQMIVKSDAFLNHQGGSQ